MYIVKCIVNMEVFILDIKNYDWIVGKKNIVMLDIMWEYVKVKFEIWMNMK